MLDTVNRAKDTEWAPLLKYTRFTPRALLRCRRACWTGALTELGGSRWRFDADTESTFIGIADGHRLELSLYADGSFFRRAARRPLQVRCFEIGTDLRSIVFETPIPCDWQQRLHRVSETTTVRISGRSLEGRELLGRIEGLSPFKLMMVVDDNEGLLMPAAQLTVHAATLWKELGSIDVRVMAVQRRTPETMLYVDLMNEGSVRKAANWALAISETFTGHTMWTFGFDRNESRDWIRISHVVDARDLAVVHELRREANQFFGRRINAEAAEWADPLDNAAIILLARLGQKSIASARLVINGGDRQKSDISARLVINGGDHHNSEILKSVHLPNFLWDHGLAEVSRLVVHPDYQGASLRLQLFVAIGRLALLANVRYLVFDSIPKLVPLYEKIGAVALPLTTRHPDSDEMETVMYLDVPTALRSFDKGALYTLILFGRMLIRYARVYGTDAFKLKGRSPNGLVGLFVRMANALRL